MRCTSIVRCPIPLCWAIAAGVAWFVASGGLALFGAEGVGEPLGAAAESAPSGAALPAVVVAKEAVWLERFAAKEVRRYVYLRTGALMPIVEGLEAAPREAVVVTFGSTMRREALGLDGHPQLPGDLFPANQGDWCVLRTIEHGGRRVHVLAGGYPAGPLYAAYRLAERLGVRFSIEGDCVPDEPMPLALPRLDERRQALFDRRGIQPFHDFPEGPDWWDADAYQAVIAQLPKLGMNFIGLHTYPEGGVGPEPAVWIGRSGEFDAKGDVAAAYPSRHFMTSNVTGSWGYRPMKTGDYAFGAAALFDADDFGPDYMRGTHPWNAMGPEASAALFNRFGDVLQTAFTLARRLGVRTCVGTETPLVIPAAVRARLQAEGKNPADPAVVGELYEGMFRRIAAKHPLDYYWFWTPEGWTWSAVPQEKIDATLSDLRVAVAAAERAEAPFTLATCGWVLGPPQNRALFDEFLPKKMPMSCINREVGHAPVEPGFAKVSGRPKWAIPWLEDDPAMILPQLWVGRMRKDAADARKYGCTGLLGIHWRTRILGPNVAALAAAAWDQRGWNPDNPASAAGATTPPAPRPSDGPDGGKHARFEGAEIAGTDDDPLYRSVRYDVGAYRFDLPDGKYAVTLKFCEPHYGEVHKRSFSVDLQGKRVIDSLDVFRAAGKNKALDYTFKDVETIDGRITIDFIYQLEYPCIAAIAIEGEKATRKINCGGDAYKDYAADWPASDTGPRDRYLASADFYEDWAAAQFGPAAAPAIAEVLARIDCRLPRPSTWVNGPGGIHPDPRPWDQVAPQYAFVDELAALMPTVAGPGNLERYNYWLEAMRYLRAVGRLNCVWSRCNAAIESSKAAKDDAARRQVAREVALTARRELIAALGEVHRHLLSYASTWGDLGTVTNWQQHVMPLLLDANTAELEKFLGEPLPADAQPPKDLPLDVPARVLVPTARTMLVEGEALRLTAIVVRPRGAGEPAVVLRWRPLGQGAYRSLPMEHVARGVYRATLAAEEIPDDFEYFVEATITPGAAPGDGADSAASAASGKAMVVRFPGAAPRVGQTVVVAER